VRFADLLGLSFSALFRHKVRTVLTVLGIVFGTFVLSTSVSTCIGVQATIMREYLKHGELREITVRPVREARATRWWRPSAVPPGLLPVRGEMSEERRERLTREILRRAQGRTRRPPTRPLTPEAVDELAALPHVRSVRPLLVESVRTSVDPRGKAVPAVTFAVPPDDSPLRQRLAFGRFLEHGETGSVVVTEILLYQLGVADDAAVEAVLGQRLRLSTHFGTPTPLSLLAVMGRDPTAVSPEQEEKLAHVVEKLPAILKESDLPEDEKHVLMELLERKPREDRTRPKPYAEEFVIRGVLRGPPEKDPRRPTDWAAEYADVFMSAEDASDLYFRVPRRRAEGYEGVVVQCDDMDHVTDTVKRIKGMGYEAFSLTELIEAERFVYLLIFSGMTITALAALAVAALGIANTMLLTVLQRTREIGLMKAVGAKDLHILLLFLGEGAAVGLTGGLLGLALAYGLSYPGDAWVRSMLEQKTSIKLDSSIYLWPWWLLLGTPLFAVLTATLAALYPARRAARIDPVAALRHE
jgi:putative ABC transport system permease protein